MSEGWAAFLGNHHVEETPAEAASRRSRQLAEAQDRRDAQAELDRQAAAEDAHELRVLAAMRSGMAARSAADIFADASRLGDEDALYTEAQRTIEKIDRRRELRRQQAIDQAEQAQAVYSMVQRSAPGDPVEEASRRAHAAFREVTRAKRNAAAAAPQRARRPFAGGVAVRSEVECEHCRKVGATPEESFLIHNDPAPLPAPAVPSEAELDMFGRLNGTPYRPAGDAERGLAVR